MLSAISPMTLMWLVAMVLFGLRRLRLWGGVPVVCSGRNGRSCGCGAGRADLAAGAAVLRGIGCDAALLRPFVRKVSGPRRQATQRRSAPLDSLHWSLKKSTICRKPAQ